MSVTFELLWSALRALLLLGVVWGFGVSCTWAQGDTGLPEPAPAPDTLEAAPVVFDGDTLFYVYHRIGSYSPRRRAALVRRNIESLDELPVAEFDSLLLQDNYDGGVDVMYRDRVINSVTAEDAASEGLTARALAQQHLDAMRAGLIAEYNVDSLAALVKDVAKFVFFLLLLVMLWIGINRLFNYLRVRLRNVLRDFVDAYRERDHGRLLALLGPETQATLLLGGLRTLRILTLLFVLYLFLPFVFSQLAYTRGFGERLFAYVTTPLKFAGTSLVSFLPKAIFILVIGWLGYQLTKLIGWVFEKVRTDQIHVDGFHADWAKPTANLLRALVVVFTLVVVYPYLPGSNSEAFKGMSVFIGLLISLGGAAAIGNVISGIILTYMRPFQVGDRVKINDTVGDIVSKNLLVTRIRTTKNEEITIPNAGLLSGGIVNYSALTHTHGLTLHTSITIGYDVPWPQVHELLLSACAKTPGLEATPAPFVLQKALQDWYVEYEVNATTREAHAMPRTYSALHANIQDAFRDAGIEIMSPHYMALRRGETSTVPAH